MNQSTRGGVRTAFGFVHPDTDTGADTRGIENRWSAVKQGLPRTGISKELFELSNVHEF